MLKECNNHDLATKNIDEKYFLFYQVWKELTERKTLDSYQYRIMNSLDALRELNDVIGYKLNQYYNTNHNINECKAETKELIIKDGVIEKYYPCVWQQLVAHLSEKTETDAQQRALKYQIEYSYNILCQDYFKHLIDELGIAINDGNKAKIVELANMVISNCASRGWSTLALHGLSDILNESKLEQTKWEIFKNRLLTTTDENYYVYIPLKVKVKVTGAQPRGIAMDKVYNEIRDMGIVLKSKSDILDEIGRAHV